VGGATPDHFLAPFVACHDERGENTAPKAKRAEDHEDDELQSLTHRNSSGRLDDVRRNLLRLVFRE
jgi:hypothetical protein